MPGITPIGVLHRGRRRHRVTDHPGRPVPQSPAAETSGESMYPASKTRRVALAAIAAGGLTTLAACGGGTSAADGSGSGSSDGSGSGSTSKTIVFSPIGLQVPAMKQLSEGVTGYGKSKGVKVTIQDPRLTRRNKATNSPPASE